MITDRTLANLRTSAALSLLVPGVSVEVWVGARRVVEATRLPRDGAAHPVLPVCAFHRSVVRAHDLRRAGTRVEMVGVDGALEPDVVVGCSPELKIVPGGVIRRAGDTWLHLCALSLAVDHVESATADVVAELGSDIDVHLHADRSLDVTIVVTDTPAGDKATARRAVELLETVAARATIDALEDWFVPAERDWSQLLVTPGDERSAGSVPGAPRRP